MRIKVPPLPAGHQGPKAGDEDDGGRTGRGLLGRDRRGLRAGGSGQPRAICALWRLASVWLAAISVVLIVKGVGA
jgi:hypothetical protein